MHRPWQSNRATPSRSAAWDWVCRRWVDWTKRPRRCCAVATNARDLEARFVLANVLQLQQRWQEAETQHRAVLEVAPRFAEAMNGLGVIAHGSTAPLKPSAHYARAIAVRPDYFEAHYNWGVTLAAQGQSAEAAGRFREAIAFRPDSADAHCMLATALQRLGRSDEAAAAYRQAIRLRPEYVVAQCNLGTVLHELGHTDEAITCFENSARGRSGFGRHVQQPGQRLAADGTLRARVGVLSQEFAICARAGRRASQSWPAVVGAGTVCRGLDAVRLASALQARAGSAVCAATMARRTTRRTDVAVARRAGTGRHDPDVALRRAGASGAAACCWKCSRRWSRWRNAGFTEVLPGDAELPSFDLHAPLLSLPGIFHADARNMAVGVPYLQADPARVAAWARSWRASPAGELESRGKAMRNITVTGRVRFRWPASRLWPR